MAKVSNQPSRAYLVLLHTHLRKCELLFGHHEHNPDPLTRAEAREWTLLADEIGFVRALYNALTSRSS